MDSGKILIVLEEEILASGLQVQFKKSGYRTEVVVSSEAALESILDEIPSLVILNIGLKGRLDGIETAAAIHQAVIFPPPIIFLDESVVALTKRSNELPPVHLYTYLVKPCTVEELTSAVEKISAVRLAG